MRLNEAVVFAAFLTAVILLFLLEATRFGHKAWIYPVLAGTPGLIFALIQLRRELKGVTSSERVFDIAMDESILPEMVKKRGIRFLIWIFGLYAAIWLIGFKAAFVIFLVLFLKIEGKLKGFKALYMILSLTFLMLFLMLFQYEKVFGVKWPKGLIEAYIPLSKYIKLPF